MALRRRLPLRISPRGVALWLARSPFAPGATGAVRITTVQRDELYPDGPEDRRIFNTTTTRFEVYRDGAWTVEATGDPA